MHRFYQIQEKTKIANTCKYWQKAYMNSRDITRAINIKEDDLSGGNPIGMIFDTLGILPAEKVLFYHVRRYFNQVSEETLNIFIFFPH